jgi:hypothetical protein
LPTRFLSLQKDYFTFENELYKVINDIRDVNSHYVHTFDKLSLLQIENSIICFLKQAFELSVLVAYLKEKEITYSQFIEGVDRSGDLIPYLCNKFFPSDVYQQEERKRFLIMSLPEAIEYILLIDVKQDIEWKIQDIHPVFIIRSGKYLSFHAHLFLLSLFLYKDEGNYLISKIKGFKRTEDNYHYKRDIFTFFSKKFNSQDNDSEEKYLVRFRDIIQYLNHFPTVWNHYLAPEKLNPSMTNELERHIIETEIFRLFPSYATHQKRDLFLSYSVQKLFNQKIGLFNVNKSALSDHDEKAFAYEIESSPELKDIDEKLRQAVDKKKRAKFLWRRKQILREGNHLKEKLLKSIKEEKIIKSYGRNHDRFMEVALRFLAEENYFGKDACFKLYRFYTTDEQNAFIKDLPKKELDKAKFHQSKLTHYSTFSEHLERYPEWDKPFVVENNAIQVVITLENVGRKLFSIQRNLMLYLLEDALFNHTQSIENNGKILLQDYFLYNLLPDFEKAKDVISNVSELTALEKSRFKKLIPKRLLYKYHAADNDTENIYNPFQKIIQEAEMREKRYNSLLEIAKRLNLEDQFSKRNKGKQFKLRFIRKAWHVMYFRQSYMQQSTQHGHHKRFHITREEFNDFSKWMYAFDEVPQYKEYLTRLFKAKTFLTNDDFSTLFHSGASLEDLYNKTKEVFEKWIDKLSQTDSSMDTPLLVNYAAILQKNIVYINISHFVKYLESKQKIKRDASRVIQYKALENVSYLIPSYYYKNILPKEEYKENGKLYNKLKTNKLEDALLYELAMRYIYLDKTIVAEAKTNVNALLTSEIAFDIKSAQGDHLYQLIVPFSKIESFAVLIEHKKVQEDIPKNQKTSFLGNVYEYLQRTHSGADVRDLAKSFGPQNKNKILRYEDLAKLNKHIISGSVKFSKVNMKLEEYFILKHATQIKDGENRINPEDIKDITGHKALPKLFNEKIRRKAFHFGIPPNEGYEKIIESMEKKFITLEIKPKGYKSYEEMSPAHKYLSRLFMNLLHSNLYKKSRSIWEFEIAEKEKLYEQTRDFENAYFLRHLK